MAFSPDRALLVTAGGSPAGGLGLWDATTLTFVRELPLPPSGTDHAVAFSASPPGRDPLVAVWDLRGGPPQILVPRAKPVAALAFSPDGQTLASGTDGGAVQLWSVAGPPYAWTPRPLEAPAEPARPVAAVSFSGDGAALAAASADGLVRLWDLRDGRLTATLSGRVGTMSVAFRPTATAASSPRPTRPAHRAVEHRPRFLCHGGPCACFHAGWPGWFPRRVARLVELPRIGRSIRAAPEPGRPP